MAKKKVSLLPPAEQEKRRAEGRKYYWDNKPQITVRAHEARKLYRQNITWQMLSLFKKARQRARIGNIPCTITREWVLNQPQMCAVSGTPFRMPLVGREPRSPSIDRKDSSKGYTPENTQFVTCFYNMAKNEWGENEIQDLIISYAEAIKKSRPVP